MNKYQDALLSFTIGTAIESDYNLLQELVDRATPKHKIQKYFNEAEPWECANRYLLRNACPSCENKMLKKNKFCPNCGQAIDWSNSD